MGGASLEGTRKYFCVVPESGVEAALLGEGTGLLLGSSQKSDGVLAYHGVLQQSRSRADPTGY